MSAAKKAVIYARFSSARQTEQSIEGQLRVCREYADENNFVVVNEYIDRAKSARTDLRPAFQQMLYDSYNDNFDIVIVYALDRFARDDGDHGTDKRILQRNGVLLLSATQQIGINADGTENLGGILTEGIYVAIAKYYSRELSQKIRRGQRECVEKRLTLGAIPPYGYIVENKKYLIDRNKADIVRDIFTQYIAGNGATTIARNLNQREIKNSKGNDFKDTHIMKIIRNQRYTGRFTYQGVTYENYLPRIVDDETFFAANRKADANRKAPARSKAHSEYLLSGRIFCGECGSPVIGESGKGKLGKYYYYYKCGAQKRGKGCNLKPVNKEKLESVVVNETYNKFVNSRLQALVIEKFLELQKKATENKEIVRLNADLKEIKKSIANVLDVIKQGIISKSLQEELLSLEARRSQIEEAIAIEESKPSLELTAEHLRYFFKTLAEGKPQNYDARKSLVSILIKRADLYQNKIIIQMLGSSDIMSPNKANGGNTPPFDNGEVVVSGSQFNDVFGFDNFGTPSGTRTLDTLIKSQVLYQLS